MASISLLNPKAELARAHEALSINMMGARGLQEVLESSFGPAGTAKMLVSGAREVKITKEGKTLLSEMYIKHPTASFIAKSASAVFSSVGDGVIATILLTSELLQQADHYIRQGIHPMLIGDGFEIAKEEFLKELEKLKMNLDKVDHSTGDCAKNPFTLFQNARQLRNVCLTTLRTKLPCMKQTDDLSGIIIDAVDSIFDPEAFFDLNMIEIMTMQQQSEDETQLVQGLVLDHGSRHPNMPKMIEDAYILTCNVCLEFEKTEIYSGFFYKSAEMREKLAKAERDVVDERVRKIIELKKKVCEGTNKGFAVINTQGIDPISLDLLARENIIGIRRAKRRNMERLYQATGAKLVCTVDNLTEDCLGRAQTIYEEVLGETKYTFIEGCPSSKSVTILIKGSNSYTINMVKDAVHCGIRSIYNSLQDGCALPGAGAVEIHLHNILQEVTKKTPGKAKFGVKAFSEAILCIPRAIYRNAGKDPLLTISEVMDAKGEYQYVLGYNVITNEVEDTSCTGVHDNYSTKRQVIETATIMAKNLLSVDEIVRAGLQSL